MWMPPFLPQHKKTEDNTHKAVQWPKKAAGEEAQVGRKSNQCKKGKEKADSTLRTSQAVPHPSTIRALCHLTSEVGRDLVYLTRYGRQQISMNPKVA